MFTFVEMASSLERKRGNEMKRCSLGGEMSLERPNLNEARDGVVVRPVSDQESHLPEVDL